MSYFPKDSAVAQKQLRVQELCLNFAVTANATPASVVVSVDDPSLLFLKTEGTNRITLAAGAVDSAAELSAITFASATDATGIFNALVRINEPLAKVVCAQLVSRTTTESLAGTLTSAPATGITSAGDKIVLNFDSAGNFATTNYDGCIIVRYLASPQ